MAKKSYLIAIDAGGTMTDTFLADEEGNFHLGKALTNAKEEFRSYMVSVSDAARQLGLTNRDIHKDAVESIYTGTTMLNLLLTRAGSKIGLLATKGFEGSPFQDRALTWIGMSYADKMHIALHRHPPALVERSCVKPVAEYINSPTWYVGCHAPPGEEIAPLCEEDVEKGVHDLVDQGVEVIAIWFLNSYTNPAHENRAAEIARKVVKQRGLNIPVITSYEVCPLSFENERLKTLLVDCYCGLPARGALKLIEKAAKDNGFKFGLETFLCYGGTVGIDYPRLNQAIVSGPTGGIIGATYLMTELLKRENVVCCDLGGTTFDVGTITAGMVSIDPEPEFGGHKLRMPMVAIDSVGAGAGTVIHIDPALKKIHLGPESAGAQIGTCYKYPEITVGDVDVVLGFLSPDYFLGGEIKLDKKAALEALTERLAKPLGIDIYEAGVSVLELLHSQLREHILGVISQRGRATTDYSLIAFGGSGPMHLWGLEVTPPFAEMCVTPWAAAFSAFGVAMGERFYRYDRTVTCVLPSGIPDEIKLALTTSELNPAWQGLEEKAVKELTAAGFSRQDIKFRYKAEARYIGQMVSWSFEVDKGRVETIEDLNKIVDSFEKTYLSIYPIAARFPEAGYAITTVICEAILPKLRPIIPTYKVKGKNPPKAAHKGERNTYYPGKWVKSQIWEMDLLEPGNQVNGPAIIEHPMTTLVVPSGRHVELDERKIIWYKVSGK